MHLILITWKTEANTLRMKGFIYGFQPKGQLRRFNFQALHVHSPQSLIAKS